jgi:hypothetical protein
MAKGGSMTTIGKMLLAAVAVAAIALGLYSFFGPSAKKVISDMVSDVAYDVAYPTTRTFLCVENGEVKRDWHFTNRWMKNQLSNDTYVVDGKTFQALWIVRNDPTLPKQNVRFRKKTVKVGTGPTLEGHSYMRTLINGYPATVAQELLFVEFNGHLESQRRPLPVCGTPRS